MLDSAQIIAILSTPPFIPKILAFFISAALLGMVTAFVIAGTVG